MKLLRYKTGKPEYRGVLDGDKVKRINGSMFLDYAVTGDVLEAGGITFLPPVLPGKIIGLRGNYGGGGRGAAPLFFMKPRSSVTAHNGAVIIPGGLDKVMAEGELAAVIGKKCRNVTEDAAGSFILGYTIGNDITGLSSSFSESFTQGKWYDTFTPLGPVIDTKPDFSGLRMETRINGVAVQGGSTDGMLFKPPFIVAALSSVMTLEPGDVILTGTPSPAAEIKPGDTVEIEIEGIGVLKNRAEAQVGG